MIRAVTPEPLSVDPSADTTPLFDTAITRLLDIRVPIVSAPMAMVSGGALAQAVSDAGGLGLVGGAYCDQPWIEQQWQRVSPDETGIGFITWRLQDQPELLTWAIAQKPKVLMLSFGDLAPLLPLLKQRDRETRLIVQVQQVAQAREVAEQGADIIVAQGGEAGGHGSSRGTLPLVPAVVDAVSPVPVLAAGGIADGRGLAASLMLGADGVLVGTAFYNCEESLAPDSAKQATVTAKGDNTVKSAVYDHLRGYDWPAPYQLRTLANSTTERWQTDCTAFLESIGQERANFMADANQDNLDIRPVIVGEAVDLIHAVQPASVIVASMAQQAAELLSNPGVF